MLLRYPNMIAWINGHTHYNRIKPHRNDHGSGFWEVTTASCIDFGQQQRLVEIVDNRDGTISIFTIAFDHDSPAATNGNDLTPRGLASISRELAANAWSYDPDMRIGSRLDRNCELLMPAPFDLATITNATLEQSHMQQKTRLITRTAAGG